MLEFKIAVFVETINNAKKLECELEFPERISHLTTSENALIVTTENQTVFLLRKDALH